MKRLVFPLFLLLNLALCAQQPRVIEYTSVPNFLKLPPDIYFGEAAGVAVNHRGHIFVLSRGNTTGPAYAAAATQLLEFGPDGKYIREIGHNLYAWSYGHAVKVDPEENIWVADKGSDVVIKFDPQDYKAVVTMRLDPQFNQIPEDSFASIQTQGLLGGKYVGISPGGSETYLKNGSQIDQTQSAIVLESLINKFFAGYASKSDDKESKK